MVLKILLPVSIVISTLVYINEVVDDENSGPVFYVALLVPGVFEGTVNEKII